jgi:hypothetical protein
MKQLKNLLIATTLLCSNTHASTSNNQDAWDWMATNPLSESPRALHSLITWMRPVTVTLPASNLCDRTQLVISLVDYYNNQLKPTMDKHLMDIYVHCHRDGFFDMHRYLTESLKTFVDDFGGNVTRDERVDLVPADFHISSHGYYEFVNRK